MLVSRKTKMQGTVSHSFRECFVVSNNKDLITEDTSKQTKVTQKHLL